jgi:dTDP-4-amino-4,6-dideoxygalactose transaminase
MKDKTMDRIYLSPPHMGHEEREFLLEAFDSNWIAPLGPHVQAFEREFMMKLDTRHAVALSSGTAALHLALKVLGIGPGDDVAISTFTFIATANAACYLSASPVFVDSNRQTWNMDPNKLSDELNRRARNGLKLPRAIIVVHLYGQCADMDPILEVCARYDIPVIEDAAEALGATYKGKPAGTLGILGAFSFNGNKIITTSGGGMLISRDQKLIEHAAFLSSQARDPAPHYEHSQNGFNYRMSNILAGIGRGQLQHLEDRVARRREINAYYRRSLSDLPGISFMPEASYGQSSCWLTCATIDPDLFGATREVVRLKLETLNIESRATWKPMHLQPVFAHCQSVGGSVSEDLFQYGLCLPSGSSMTEEDLERVVRGIRSCCAGQ